MVKRIALGTMGLFVFFATIYLTQSFGTEDYVTTFADLEPEASSRVINYLDEEHIPYKLENSGKNILLPSGLSSKVSINVAGQKLIIGGEGLDGYFKKSVFGMTRDRARILYRLGLQEDMRRTLMNMEEITDARVHIVLSKKSTFREDSQDATASVALQLNKKLSPKSVEGIVNLMASAIEGLEPGKVTVLDQKGNVLSGPTTPEMAAANQSMEFVASQEMDTRRKIETLLNPVLGKTNLAIEVKIESDFNKVIETFNNADPEGSVIVSENIRTRTNADVEQTSEGLAGVASNLPGAGNGEPGPAKNKQVVDTQKTTNYEITRHQRTVEHSMGRVTRMNISVVINERPPTEANTSGGAPTPNPRTVEEIQKLEVLIKAAVGFNAERGDQLAVTELPFLIDPLLAELGKDLPAEPEGLLTPEMWKGVNYGMVLVLAILVLVFMVRPLIKAVSTSSEPIALIEEQEGHTAGLSMPGIDPITGLAMVGMDGLSEGDVLASLDAPSPRSLAVDFASQEPRKTAQILRAWLLEDSQDLAGPGLGMQNSASPQKAAPRA